MSNRLLPIIGVVVAIVLFLIYSSIFVVNQREQALVLRFGVLGDKITDWAHLDMSAPSWAEKSELDLTKGATG